MKKTLIAAATAILATTAYAQSSVEVYGLIDMSITSTKATEDTTVTKTRTTANEGNDSPTRIGFRGTEDLGNGLKAGFVIESGSTLGDRLANLSLASSLGTVTLGKYYNAFDDVLTGVGMGDNILNKSWMQDLELTTSTNGIAYTSPEFNGFSFGLGLSQVKTTEAGTTTNNDRTREISLNYANGPLTAMAAFGNAKTVALDLEFDAVFEAENAKLSSSAFQVAYDFGFAVPYVIYARDKLTTGAVTTNPPLTSLGAKQTGYEIGSSIPMGAFTPFLTVSRTKLKYTLDGVEEADQLKGSGNQVGVTYDLSKRTKLYAVVSNTKIKDGGVTTNKNRETAAGIVHSF